MTTDRSINRAMEDGQRNADGFAMVKNWCANVRIEKMGGVGMIEQMTGLPIGHHGLACDHASAAGMMCWYIRDAALDFYDRYCKSCGLRKPVGVPNLGSWVTERDAAVVQQRAREEAEAREVAAKLAARQSMRAQLRMDLSPVAADVIDQIEELDIKRESGLTDRLVETAKLAPEAFPPQVIDYAFNLLEAHEHWFDEAGLRLLAEINANPRRLARCAMVCLQRASATHFAARVLLARLGVADENLISQILPTLIAMARPSRRPFAPEQVSKIAPLVRISEAFPQQVKTGINSLLDQGPGAVGLAARAMHVLARRNPELGLHFSRDLIGKLVRAPWMPDPEDHGDDHEDIAIELFDAIVELFLIAPDATDKLLQNFRLGASTAGEIRIFSVYSRVLRSGRFGKTRSIGHPEKLAFRRLLWEAPKATNFRILMDIQSAIGDRPGDLSQVAQDEVDSLLGAAILLDERIVALDGGPSLEKTSMLDMMERDNQRSMLARLRNDFVSWAAVGAAESGRVTEYLKVLEGLPESRDSLAATMIKNVATLMDTAAGLNAALPSLFSALVGTSVARRGSAAEAIGEMRTRQRENAPDLLLEAFMTTLTDSYIYVHHSAVDALRSMELPPSFDAEVRTALWQLLFAHRGDERRIDIVLKCVDLLASRYLTEAGRTGKAGAFLVEVLAELPAWRISRDVCFLARHLPRAHGLTALLVRLLHDPETTEYGENEAVDALAALPTDVIFENRGVLVGAFSAEAGRVPEHWVLEIVQILGRSRAWDEAEKLSAAALAAVPSTVREMPRRQIYELTHAAVSFERALARGELGQAEVLAQRWRELRAAEEGKKT